jgi:hypothetical protein
MQDVVRHGRRAWQASDSAGVPAAGNIHHGYDAPLVIDLVDDPVRATACAEPVVQWGQKALADAMRLLQ